MKCKPKRLVLYASTVFWYCGNTVNCESRSHTVIIYAKREVLETRYVNHTIRVDMVSQSFKQLLKKCVNKV